MSGSAAAIVGDPAISPPAALWLFSVFTAVHRRPFDSALFAQRFPPPLDELQFAAAATELGLERVQTNESFARALDRRFPVALRLSAPPAAGPTAANAIDWIVVLNVGEGDALVLTPGAQAPATRTLTELKDAYAGTSLTLHPHAPALVDADGVSLEERRFGLRWFLPELLKHRTIWRDVLIASLVIQLMALALPLFTQVIIDKVVVHRTESTLIALTVAMGLFLIFTAVLSWIRQYLVMHTGNRVDAVLGSAVFDHLFKLPPAYFQARTTGVIAARLHGVETIREFIASAAVTLILDLPFLAIFLAIMLSYSLTLSAIVLGVLAVTTALSIAVGPLFQRKLNEQFLRGAATQSFLTEYVAGVETVKSLQFEPQLSGKYRELLSAYLRACFATRQIANTYGTWAQALDQLMSLLILTAGAWLVMTSASFTVGMLVAFQMFASRVSQPVMRLVGLWQQWQQTRLAVERLGDVMNAPAEPYSATPRRVASGGGAITFEGVAFRYADTLPYLYENLSFSVSGGQLVAITGPSGVGKSTLARLLLGFHFPSRGAIRVDGIDLRHLSANELRSFFGVVPQETVLFSGTILDNLKLANPYATFEQVVAACKMAEIHATIEALPQGYQTTIGERGAGLSGGQRQRIAIARALLKGPKVLIFDESTSAVDAATAETLGRTISTLRGRVTILFIAHHLPRTLHCDQAIRLGDRATVLSSEPVPAGASA